MRQYSAKTWSGTGCNENQRKKKNLSPLTDSTCYNCDQLTFLSSPKKSRLQLIDRCSWSQLIYRCDFEIDSIVKTRNQASERCNSSWPSAMEQLSVVYGYGRVSDSHNIAPNGGDDVFENRLSNLKLFTALILSDMANRGEVRLDDPG